MENTFLNSTLQIHWISPATGIRLLHNLCLIVSEKFYNCFHNLTLWIFCFVSPSTAIFQNNRMISKALCVCLKMQNIHLPGIKFGSCAMPEKMLLKTHIWSYLSEKKKVSAANFQFPLASSFPNPKELIVCLARPCEDAILLCQILFSSCSGSL